MNWSDQELSSGQESNPDHELESHEESSPVRRPRGRPSRRIRGRTAGRGRGRPGSRARGLGRNRRGAVANRADVALQSLEERRNELERKIDGLSEEMAKEVLKKTAEKFPSLLFDLVVGAPVGGGGYHPSAGQNTPSWCVCGNCREMPTEEEKVCCGMQPNNCISQIPDFVVLILDEAVLALARLHRAELLVLPEDQDINRANRHAAYRQFVLWQHGRLGTGIRRVIPSCCVWRIRDKFQDPFGQYTGYKPSRFH